MTTLDVRTAHDRSVARAPRRRRRFLAGVAAGVLLALVAVTVTQAVGEKQPAGQPAASQVTAEQVSAFYDGLLPIVTDWGSVEVRGMRPAVSDLRSGEGVPAEAIASEARAWTSSFENNRRQLAELESPAELAAVEGLFDRSLARYLAAAELFRRAAEASPSDRAGLIDEGVVEAAEGARLFDDAAGRLLELRAAVGLPPTDDFPGATTG